MFLIGDTCFPRFVFRPAQPSGHFFSEESGISNVFVDRVCGHFCNVLSSLGLYVECDQAIGHQVVDGLEPLLTHKVLPIMEEPVV